MQLPPAAPVNDRAVRLLVLLGTLFVACVVLAELIGVKLFQLEYALGIPKADMTILGTSGLSFVLTVGVLPWPLVFILTDVVNDYYGVRGVRLLTFLTAGILVGMFALLYLAIGLPPDMDWWIGSSATAGVPDMQAGFAAVFGQGLNIIIGSLTAFVIGQMVDALIFRRLKRITGDRRIWLRATGSTVVSQLIDSVVVTYVAFWVFRDMSFAHCTALVITAYLYKFTVALLSTPLLYVAHAAIRRYLGAERAQAMRTAALAQA